MRLNPDCIRAVLLRLEELPYHAEISIPDLSNQIEEFSKEEVEYTCLKLYEAGFILATPLPRPSIKHREVFSILDISYAGHQFIETVRDPKAWRSIKKGCASVGNFALKTISAVAEGVTTAAIQRFLSATTQQNT